MSAAFLLTLFLQVAQAAPAYLCVGEQDAARVVLDRDPCALQPASGTTLALSDRERPLIAFDRGRAQFVFGRIGREQSVVDWLDAQRTRGAIALSVDATACPAAEEFSIALTQPASATKWLVQLDRRATSRVRQLAADAGSYDVTIAAPGCRTLVRNVVLEAGKTLALGPQTLRATPRLAGRVLNRATGKEVEGAIVVLPDETSFAISDAAGRFSGDPGDDWPRFLKVSYPGFAETTVAVPITRASADLPPVFLEKGGRLELTVDRADAGEMPLTVHLFRAVEGQRPSLFRSAKLASGDTTLSLDGLSSGHYLAELLGPSPFQRVAEELTIRDEEVRRWRPKLAPIHLRARVVSSDGPVANAESTFRDRQGLWSASLRFDAAGQAQAELWQGGSFSVVTTAPSLPSPNISIESFGDESEVEWTLRIAADRVTGTVVDESEAPVPAARVWLRTDTPEGTSATIPATTDASGRFAFTGVAAGAQSLEVAADGFLPSEPFAFTLDEQQRSQEARVVLRKGAAQELRISTAAGAPVADAMVVQWTPGFSVQTYATDALGHVRLQLPAEAATVFVFPREGSFAIAHLARTRDAEGASLPVVVPDGSASIELTAKSISGTPIPDVIVLMRVNGDVFPPEVLEYLRRTQGLVFRSGSDGRLVLNHTPPGLYEFWPHGNLDEANAILANLAAPAPVQLAVRPGMNAATMTFRAAGSR